MGYIEFQLEKKSQYAFVIAKGIRDNFKEIAEGANQIFSMIDESQLTRALLDYREVIFNLPQSQAFNLIKHYENKIPNSSQLIIAVIVNAQTLIAAQLWSEIAVSRGFQYHAFNSFEEAENWLLSSRLSV